MEVIAIAFSASLLWCLAALRLGPWLGFVDRPSDDPHLKIHRRPAVPLGGVGIYLAVFAGVGLTGEIDLTVLVASTVVLVLGLVDERFGLTPILRVVVETGVAVFVVVGWDLAERGILDALLAGLLIVVAINAVNLFDGLDGLAGLTGAVTAVALAVLANLVPGSSTFAAALVAGLVGFLIFNWHPARVFLGDAGSYLLGLLLAIEIVRLSPIGGFQLVATSAVMGVFAVDLSITLIRRRLHRRPLFEGDRSHVYDQLRDRGWSVPKVVVIASTAQALIAAGVLVANELMSPVFASITGLAMLLALTLYLASAGFLSVDQSAR